MFQGLASSIFWFIICILLGIVAIVFVIVILFLLYISGKYVHHLAKDLHLRKVKPLYTKFVLKLKEQINYYTGIRFIK